MKESNVRSFIKGISWRLVGTLDTIMISFFITGRITHALSIGMIEVFTKILLFYVHERAWIFFTRNKADSRIRSAIKAFTWRATGSLDTFFISFMIVNIGGGENAGSKAASIASIELFTKIALYYLHERVWNRIPFGKIKDKQMETSLKPTDVTEPEPKQTPKPPATGQQPSPESSP